MESAAYCLDRDRVGIDGPYIVGIAQDLRQSTLGRSSWYGIGEIVVVVDVTVQVTRTEDDDLLCLLRASWNGIGSEQRKQERQDD